MVQFYLLQAAARQAALLAACLGFCAMQQLQVLVQPSSLDTVGAQVDMLSAVSSILTQQEVLGLQRGAFIRLALGRFSDALQLLKDLPAGLCNPCILLASQQLSSFDLPCEFVVLRTLLRSRKCSCRCCA